MYYLKQRNGGQALLIITVIFAAVATAAVLGSVSPVIRQLSTSKNIEFSKKSYFTAEAASEDAYYRMRNGLPTSYPRDLVLDGVTASVSVNTIGVNEQEIVSVGRANDHVRTVVKDLTVTNGFSFRFGIQTGVGSLYLHNNSSVNGNVYSNGQVIGNNTSPNSYNLIYGSVISAGASGLVRQVRATSSVYAHTIQDTTIDKDAYYQSISGSTVGGVSYPNSTDQPPVDFPIADTLIEEWKTDASNGGSVTCSGGNYTINSSITLGPKKIPCNLTISGNNTVLTLTGSVWVEGDMTITGTGGSGVQIKVSDTLGNKSVVMVADNPSNSTGSGMIAISGNSNFFGSTGNENSYVMLVSQNTSAENGGSNIAIDVINGAAGNLLVYAPHGEIRLQNNVNLRQVVSYKLSLYNNTVVNYSLGLAQSLFTSGPGGTWKIKRWKEI